MTAEAREQAELTVELGTGFVDADVAVLIDGAEVWHKRGVTTNYSVGIADVVLVPVLVTVAAAPIVEVRVGGEGHRTNSVSFRATGARRVRCDLDPTGALSIGPAPEGPVF